MHLKAAANFINNRYYKEALNVLNQMDERYGDWYYLCAVSNIGLGNNVAALDLIRQAISMDPYNMQYQQLERQLENGGGWYQDMQMSYGSPLTGGVGVCCSICMMNLLCDIIYGGGCC